MQRLGIYGGTFDPIHQGHAHVITELIARKIVDTILVVPAGQPRLRVNEPLATPAQRRDMCELACRELAPEIAAHVVVSPIETLRPGPTFTIDTVEAVHQAYPDDEIVLVLGSDAYASIEKWHRIDELRDMVEFVVIDRPEFSGVSTLDIDALAVSATSIRSGGSDLVATSVAAYIKEHNLYARK